jgi:light-regulated signal transduction histidine kinase (bacteriophytochrome)
MRRLMEVAVENLLQNAWKFSVHQPVARIRMGGLRVEGQEVFFVADNGVGFDPQYAANLFVCFSDSTLQPRFREPASDSRRCTGFCSAMAGESGRNRK